MQDWIWNTFILFKNIIFLWRDFRRDLHIFKILLDFPSTIRGAVFSPKITKITFHQDHYFYQNHHILWDISYFHRSHHFIKASFLPKYFFQNIPKINYRYRKQTITHPYQWTLAIQIDFKTLCRDVHFSHKRPLVNWAQCAA